MHLYSAYYHEFHPFDKFYPTATLECVLDPKQLEVINSLLIVWGGADIHPSLYDRPTNGSHVGQVPSVRDVVEWNLMVQAKQLGIPIIGVCRGAQMLCALQGGRLVQDVTGHSGAPHPIQDVQSGDTVTTSSVHHQMMYPFDRDGNQLPGEIVAVSKPISHHYMDLNDIEKEKLLSLSGEPEIYYFKDGGIGIQGHPEYMSENYPFNKYVKRIIDTYVKPHSY